MLDGTTGAKITHRPYVGYFRHKHITNRALPKKNLGFDPKELKNLDAQQLLTPNEDDTYSPLHDDGEDSSSASPDSSDEATEKPA